MSLKSLNKYFERIFLTCMYYLYTGSNISKVIGKMNKLKTL